MLPWSLRNKTCVRYQSLSLIVFFLDSVGFWLLHTNFLWSSPLSRMCFMPPKLRPRQLLIPLQDKHFVCQAHLRHQDLTESHPLHLATRHRRQPFQCQLPVKTGTGTTKKHIRFNPRCLNITGYFIHIYSKKSLRTNPALQCEDWWSRRLTIKERNAIVNRNFSSMEWLVMYDHGEAAM